MKLSRRSLLRRLGGAVAAAAIAPVAKHLAIPSSFIFPDTPISPPAITFVNDPDTGYFIPEIWANESFKILESNMVMAQIVHRDFADPLMAEVTEEISRRQGYESFSALRDHAA